ECREEADPEEGKDDEADRAADAGEPGNEAARERIHSGQVRTGHERRLGSEAEGDAYDDDEDEPGAEVARRARPGNDAHDGERNDGPSERVTDVPDDAGEPLGGKPDLAVVAHDA